jgi:nicotinate phosphoribosyltransferase
VSEAPAGERESNAALLTDLYQLTMLQAYWHEGLEDRAAFSLFCRRLPEARNYLLACGLDDVLRYLETLRFTPEALGYLRGLDLFREAFLGWLAELRFTGDVYAVPEGTPVFPDEPLLELVAPIGEAQLVESYLINQIHLQTVLASKAARVVAAARGRKVVDFGMRRMQGADAALKGARAFAIAGVDATSNLLAGLSYGIPVSGTMAHSYVQAHRSELESFRAFSQLYPETVLLVDSYDTLEGVRRVVDLARERGSDFSVRGIRLDSGDLGALAREARSILDAAGLEEVEIFASGNLDEHAVAELVEQGAPITGFGVGTRMGVSSDAPTADLAYKLTEYAGIGRCKLSPDKTTLPGRKQVFRIESRDGAERDLLARWDESLPGRPLLQPAMRQGVRLAAAEATLDEIRTRAAREIARLPPRLQALEVAEPPYPVELSDALREDAKRLQERLARGVSPEP